MKRTTQSSFFCQPWGGVTVLFAAVAMTGCTSGDAPYDDGRGANSGGGLLTAHEGTTHYVTSFDEADAQAVRNSPEFVAQDNIFEANAQAAQNSREFVAQHNIFGPPRLENFGVVTRKNAFSVINLEYAHSIGLSGAGQLIAIIDSGFRTTHRELAGKTITTYGTFPAPFEDHGTGVAAVAAGQNDGFGMMGVAPGADLHLSALPRLLSDLTGATNDAHAAGAVAQNNSWGFDWGSGPRKDETITVNDINGAAGSTLSQKIANAMEGSASDWSQYIDSLRQFTTEGVVVFAASNRTSDNSASFIAALPSLDPSLQGSWIVGVNAVANYDSGGDLISATRISAECLEAAAYCLTGQGFVYTAMDTGDAAYENKVGTSFVAPQISGAVALLSEAFPNLYSSEIVDRLLASANNSFFTRASGSVDFGNGVIHSYNEEFGHGLMDLRAALLPIGSLGAATTSVASDPTVPVSQVSMVSGSAQGNAIANALAGRQMALFDALGTDFYVPATILTAEADDNFDERLKRFTDGAGQRMTTEAGSFGFSTSTDGLQPIDSSLVFGWAEDVGAQFGINPTASPSFADPASLLGLAPQARAFGTGTQLPGGNLGFFAFADSADEDRQTFGLGASRAFRLDGGAALTFGLTGTAEAGSFLGLRLAEESTFETASMAFNAGVSVPVGAFEVFVNSEFGASRTNDAGLMTAVEPALFTGFAVGTRMNGLWNRSDALTFSVQQPLRIESGQASLRLAVGRDRDARVFYEDVPVDLEPDARQIDFGFDYATPLSPVTDLRFGAAFSLNEGHASGNTGGNVMAAIAHRF